LSYLRSNIGKGGKYVKPDNPCANAYLSDSKRQKYVFLFFPCDFKGRIGETDCKIDEFLEFSIRKLYLYIELYSFELKKAEPHSTTLNYLQYNIRTKKKRVHTYMSLLVRCSQNFSQKDERCLILRTLVLRVRGNLSLEASSPPSEASSSGAVRSEGADIPDRRDGDEEIASPPPQRPPKENPLNILSESSSARMVCYIPVINKFNS
jgi:hypothetical protein